jgi:hypothetical protein
MFAANFRHAQHPYVNLAQDGAIGKKTHFVRVNIENVIGERGLKAIELDAHAAIRAADYRAAAWLIREAHQQPRRAQIETPAPSDRR